MVTKSSKKPYPSIFLGGIIAIAVVLIILITLLLDKSTSRKPVPNTQESIDRSGTIDEIMQSLLGRHWPYVLGTILIILLLLLGLLYIFSRNVQVNLDPKQTKVTNITLIAMLVVFVSVIIYLFVHTLKKNLQKNSTVSIGGGKFSYLPEEDKNKKTMQIVYISLGIVGLLAVMGGVYWFLFKKRNK